MCFQHKSYHIPLLIKVLNSTLSLMGHSSRSVDWGDNVNNEDIYWQLLCFVAVCLSGGSTNRQLSTSPSQEGEKESQGFVLWLWGFLLCSAETTFSVGPTRSRRWRLLCLSGKGEVAWPDRVRCCPAVDGRTGGSQESGWGGLWYQGWRPAPCSFMEWLVEAGTLVRMVSHTSASRGGKPDPGCHGGEWSGEQGVATGSMSSLVYGKDHRTEYFWCPPRVSATDRWSGLC